jgi:hypothetical protein
VRKRADSRRAGAAEFLLQGTPMRDGKWKAGSDRQDPAERSRRRSIRASMHSMRGTAALIALAAAAGCGGYHAGSFASITGEFAGERRTVGCLDLAVAPVDDAAAEGPVAAVTFANRCDAAVVVDLPSIRATGRGLDGREVAMGVFDPDREIRAGLLEARTIGRELIEFQPLGGGPAPYDLCLDVSRLDPGAPSATPVVVCLRGGTPSAVAQGGGR